jgi:hypothetical protein
MTMKLSEIARRINVHLKRFEKDGQINAPDPKYKTRPYYLAYANAGGRFVYVTYIAYQGRLRLKREEAIKYLDWLDGGNVGKHFEIMRA